MNRKPDEKVATAADVTADAFARVGRMFTDASQMVRDPKFSEMLERFLDDSEEDTEAGPEQTEGMKEEERVLIRDWVIHDWMAAREIVHDMHRRWWQDANGNAIERNQGEMFALIHSEISEAAEGDLAEVMDDHLPTRPMVEVEIADTMIRVFDYSGGFRVPIKDARWTVQELWGEPKTKRRKGDHLLLLHLEVTKAMEAVRKNHSYQEGRHLSRVLAMCLAFGKGWGLDVPGAVVEKLEYNANRADHKHENRAKDGGKKF